MAIIAHGSGGAAVKEIDMSEHTKGKLECFVVSTNAIDIVSKEDKSVVVASIMSEEDELGDLEIANAHRLKLCWNRHDVLLAACEDAVKLLKIWNAESTVKAQELLESAIGSCKEKEIEE